MEGDRGLDRRLRRDRPLLAVVGGRDERGPDELPALERRVVAGAGSRREALPDRLGRDRPLRAQARGRPGAERRRPGRDPGVRGRPQGAGIAAVNSVETGPEQLAENERAQLVQVAFQGEAADEPVKDAVKELRDEAAVLLAGSGLQAGLTGDAASVVDTEESFGNAETITFAATFVLILLLVGGIFRSPIAAFLPLATIGLVFLLSTSLVALLSDTFGFEVDASLTSLLIVVLFGIGTDYILFLLFRYRERLRAGDESRAAVAFSVRRVGQAVASSALVVIIAFLALLLASLGFFRTMAPGLVISVAVTLLASLTLIPAAIALVGPRVFWPSKRWQTAPTGTTFKRLGQLIARRPGRMALASGGAMLALAAGAIFYTANYDTSSSLPSDTESSQANEDIRGAFAAGAADPTDVYVSGSAPLQQSELAVLVTELRAIDGVDSVGEPILSEDRTGARIGVNLTESATSNAALDVAEGPLRDVAHASTAGDEVRVGGASSAFADIRSALERDILVVFPIAALLIALVLGLLLRSVIAPLYLLGAVALGFVATLGAGVALFQGLGSEPGLLFILPVLLYMFVVAIGTDYNILMTTRLREEMQEGNDPRTAAESRGRARRSHGRLRRHHPRRHLRLARTDRHQPARAAGSRRSRSASSSSASSWPRSSCPASPP